MVPNHAIIIHALLHGEGDFQRSLMIANTCGWDTDCNSGNVGAIVGVQLGLAAIDAGPDWRGPVADRILIPTADGGRTVSDAVRETEAIVTTAKRLRGEEAVPPKDGARFHFSYPGSLQGFDGPVENYEGKLRLRSEGTARTLTRTWITPEDKKIAGYGLYASPTIYSGQVVRASVVADRPVVARLVVEIYDSADQLQSVLGPSVSLDADVADTLEWTLPDFEGYPIARVGIEVDGSGVVDLDWLRWDGAPQVRFIRTAGGKAFRQAWTDAVEEYHEWAPAFRLVQNEGVGLISAGTREWTDYAVSASLSLALGDRFGLVARYQGLRRYYGLVLSGDGRLQLVRVFNDEFVLDERDVAVELNREYLFELRVAGSDIVGVLDGEVVLRATDEAFANGGIGLMAEAGRMDASWVEVRGVS